MSLRPGGHGPNPYLYLPLLTYITCIYKATPPRRARASALCRSPDSLPLVPGAVVGTRLQRPKTRDEGQAAPPSCDSPMASDSCAPVAALRRLTLR
eukprot:363592-Chlamydomonas_euryale.AAC.1